MVPAPPAFGLAVGQAIVSAAPALAAPPTAGLAPSQGEWDAAFLKEEDLEAEDEHGRKSVYLVTLPALRMVSNLPGAPAPGAAPRICPSGMTHEQVANMVLNAFTKPVRASANGGPPALLNAMVVFRERHAPAAGETQGPVHWHIALRAGETFRFLPYKKALLYHHGVSSHWSTTHMGYWSAVRYGVMPSPKKPQEALDGTPWPWARVGGHPPLFEVCQQPNTSSAMQERREKKVKLASEKGEKEPRPTEFDLYPIIVMHGFKNTPDDQTADQQLVQWVRKHASPALAAFTFKMRHKLGSLIDDVWSWEAVDDTLALLKQTRVERLAAAAQSLCQCGGRWPELAQYSLTANRIDPVSFCTSVMRSLREGRGPHVKTVVLMGFQGGEGKSFFFSPMKNVYGTENLQLCPQPGNFPLLELEKKKVAVLDEWTFDPTVVPLATQLLWLEGKPFVITRPQNKDYTGHLMYKGTAPLFITCKQDDLGPILTRAHTAVQMGTTSADTMLARRLSVHQMWEKLPIRPDEHVPECASCFARLLFHFSR